MKTAISIPDEIFARADRCATALGLSRSEFFTRAAQSYLHQVEASSLTEQIDSAVALIGVDESGRAAVEAGRRRLAEVDTEADW